MRDKAGKTIIALFFKSERRKEIQISFSFICNIISSIMFSIGFKKYMTWLILKPGIKFPIISPFLLNLWFILGWISHFYTSIWLEVKAILSNKNWKINIHNITYRRGGMERRLEDLFIRSAELRWILYLELSHKKKTKIQAFFVSLSIKTERTNFWSFWCAALWWLGS